MKLTTDKLLVEAFDKFCEEHEIETGMIIIKGDNNKFCCTVRNPEDQTMDALRLLIMAAFNAKNFRRYDVEKSS